MSDTLIRNSKQLGRLVRQIRTSKGLSQSLFAEKIGVTRQWVGMLEQGKPRLELELTLRALAALGMSINLIENSNDSLARAPERKSASRKRVQINLDEIIKAHSDSRKS